MTPARPTPAQAFSFEGLLHQGDTVVCGQACAEPLSLTRRLVRACADGGPGVRVFIGTLLSDTFDSAPASMRFTSYGAIGKAGALADRSMLDVVPERYSSLGRLFGEGHARADVVLLQCAVDADGVPSFGLACDYLLEAARRARLVIAEVNGLAPWTFGTPWPADLRVDQWVAADLPPLELGPPALDATAHAIASHVAGIVPDGATLQVGIGNLPDATLAALASHRHLGLHSGVLGDAGVDLIRRGVLDNSRKRADRGIAVTNTICASAQAYRFAHKNPGIEVRHLSLTHDVRILSEVPRLHAINSALEVDLGGQANCEMLQGRARGGVGGLLDFARGARASEGGRGILVLPATAAKGAASRIVPRLSGPATIGHADVDLVVTEFGVADLRGQTLAERAQRMIAIAAPAFRDELQSALRRHPETSHA